MRVFFEVSLLRIGILEVGTVFTGPGLCKAWSDPYGTSDPVIEVVDFLLEIGDDLDATASSANHGYALPIKWIAFIERSGVHELAFIILESGYVRPLEIVQDTTSVDEEFCLILKNIPGGKIFDLEFPDTILFVPLGVLDLVSELDILVDKVVLLIDALEVIKDLW